jgi:predicted membrane channel-forming protein YqfA (hemolysin III family)
MKKKLIVLGSVLGMPMLTFAQTTSGCKSLGVGGDSTLTTLLCNIGNILNSVVPILVALGVVYFVWGVVSYVIASDEEAKSAGRNRMIWGIIGLAVIVGMWGLVNILGKTFGLQNGPAGGVTLPTVIINQTP